VELGTANVDGDDRVDRTEIVLGGVDTHAPRHQRALSRDDGARLAFLDCLDEACGKAGWEVHAWCVMSNHF